MSQVVIKNANVLLPDLTFACTDVVLEDGIIAFVGKTDAPGTDLSGKYLIPGLVDIHTHGAGGGDHLDGDPAATAAILRRMAQVGTTTVLSTIMTQSRENMCKAAENTKLCATRELGARIRGIYLEGPFFSEQYKGAQHPMYLIDPEHDLIDQLQAASGNLLKIVSLAPEKTGALDFIRSRTDVRIFAGHTAADYDTAAAAFDAGARGLTHSFNGMTPLHHRKPGVLAAAMEREQVFCECICDGFHVHKAMVGLLYRQVGAERFCMISDSLRPAGLPDGEYLSGGQPVTVKDGKAHLADGTIAGSTACLLEEVKNLVSWGICDLAHAVYAASAVPARAAGIDDQVGTIEAGKAADLLVLSENLDLQAVYIGGKPWVE